MHVSYINTTTTSTSIQATRTDLLFDAYTTPPASEQQAIPFPPFLLPAQQQQQQRLDLETAAAVIERALHNNVSSEAIKIGPTTPIPVVTCFDLFTRPKSKDSYY